MSRRIKQSDHDKLEGDGTDGGFLSRWSARKSQIARGETVPEEVPLPPAEDGAGLAVESDEDAALSDAELLEKYELPDPEEVTEETGLDHFMSGDMPERLRQMALRRLWRLNPMFGIVDDMVEYGEDYTDAAVVIEGMQTAYTAGKGYARKAVEPEEMVEDQAEDEINDGQVDQAEESGSDDAVTDDIDKTDNSAENAAEDAKNQRATVAGENMESHNAESAVAHYELLENQAKASAVLRELAENAPDFVAVMPATSPLEGKEPLYSDGANMGRTSPDSQSVKSGTSEESQPFVRRPARMSFHKNSN
ncbi:MAG: DUF3306 domain-containing protein [Candidatus Puniceispirillum sp.]|nr:DUF3306 domain-containing protein [Candidatus Puniceispirillum sp.]MBL6775027.1 DUF3306 domain-containing protein [Candidatus Puniceispirillum sp.]